MFGNKKTKQLEEQNRALLAELAEKKEGFDADIAKIEELNSRMQGDIAQVTENSEKLVEHSNENLESCGKLLHGMENMSKELKVAETEYEELRERVDKHLESTIALVEENKHFTSPAKYITETPANMRIATASYVAQLNAMEEDGRRMGVLALNAAIEAGRMGESAKSFVAASEEIRQFALSYEKKAISLREELERGEARISELEEVVARLVALMKESNMGTTRLLKKTQELHGAVKNSSMRGFSEEVVLMRDTLVDLRNTEEEIAKCGERNRLSLSDIGEDAYAGKQRIAELESDISYMFDVLAGDAER